MSDENSELNTSVLQSAVRKKEYKHLLEIGGQTAENVDNISTVDNFIALRDLLMKSNELIGQGTLTDRIGQSAEVVLDAQVHFPFHFHNIANSRLFLFFQHNLVRFANWLVI